MIDRIVWYHTILIPTIGLIIWEVVDCLVFSLFWVIDFTLMLSTRSQQKNNGIDVPSTERRGQPLASVVSQ